MILWYMYFNQKQCIKTKIFFKFFAYLYLSVVNNLLELTIVNTMYTTVCIVFFAQKIAYTN